MKSIKSIGFTFFLASQFVPSLAKEDDYKELWDACAYCDHGIVKKYAAEDPNIATTNTVSGETCLMLTAVSNCISVAELMIELGADVNAVVDHPSGHRNTPLAWHTYKSNAEIVNLLIKNRADVNANFDAVEDPGLKITALDIADAIAHKKNMDEASMQTFLNIRQRGGIKYKQWETEERLKAEGKMVL